MQACERTVLVVDINVEVTSALAMLFESYAFHAVRAHDVDEALAAARSSQPDLVVMDLDMPAGTAYRIARQIRTLPWDKPMLMVGMSGWGDQVSRARSGAAGFDAHFAKPIDFTSLRAYLSALDRPP
jgi:CheY-like chemotaxis protein